MSLSRVRGNAQRINADCPVITRTHESQLRATAQRRRPEALTPPVTFQALCIYCPARRTQIDLAALLSNLAHGSDDPEWNRIALSRPRMESHRTGHTLDCVAGRNLKQRMVRLGALDSSELISRFAEAGVAVFAHHSHLEVRRSPHLGSNFDGLGVANLSRGDRSRDSLAFDGNTLHCQSAQCFCFRFFRLVPA